MDAYLGAICSVAFNYAPAGWLPCNGQKVSIQQYMALYSLLGTRWGPSNGSSYFSLPDLRGRTMVGSQGTGPGLTAVGQGAAIGVNSAPPVVGLATANPTLSLANLPAHSHTMTVPASAFGATSTLHASATAAAGAPVPVPGAILSGSGNSGPLQAGIYYTGSTALPALPTVALHPASVTTTITNGTTLTSSSVGGGTALGIPVQTTAPSMSVMQPSLGMFFIICVDLGYGYYPSRN